MTEIPSAGVESSVAALRQYNGLIQPARDRFATGRGIRGMTSPDTDARTMAAFLLHFSALSVPITEPVEGWIRRAGERCTAIGLTELGKALQTHSKAEAGHQQYHIDDFVSMVSLWNRTRSPAVRPEQISDLAGC